MMPPDSHTWLAIDAGNTRIKWGVFDGAKWNPCGALPSAESFRLKDAWNAVPPGIPAIASNVAGDAVQADLERACRETGRTLRTIAAEPEALGIVNGYSDPRQLGTDRWAGLIAAHGAHRGHKLVVNAGTALTIDALLDDGHFLGGVIVAGPALMRRALDRGTAGLRLTEGRFEPLPTSTPDAITSGSIQASAGAVERMRAAMQANGTPVALIVLSGGATQDLRAHLPEPLAVEENLVLDGLVRIARGG